MNAMLKTSVIGISFMLLILPHGASAQYPYNKKCTSHALRPEYCVFKCETGIDLIVVERHSYSQGKRFPDAQTYTYGTKIFTLANNSIPGSTASMYGDTKSPNGTGVSGWNKYKTLMLNGKSIRCKPSWL